MVLPLLPSEKNNREASGRFFPPAPDTLKASHHLGNRICFASGYGVRKGDYDGTVLGFFLLDGG